VTLPRPTKTTLDADTRLWTGMHFGTFIGAESESLEAIIELAEAVEDAGVKTLDDPNEDEMGRMGVIDVGETWCTESESLTFFAFTLSEWPRSRSN
jgi:hypothetical protein